MRKAESAALTRPKVTTPIGTGVAVRLAEIIHEQGLRPMSESNHTDVANANQYVVKVVVSFPSREVLEMRIICGGDCCRKEIHLENELYNVNVNALPVACGKQTLESIPRACSENFPSP